jgi:putative holliday junction resolvase
MSYIIMTYMRKAGTTERPEPQMPEPIASIAELKQHLPRGARLLGLDVGTKTIGLALSDTTLTVASALETIRRAKFAADAARIGAIVAAQGIGGFVIGLPINMDGSEGPRCQSVRQFGRNLSARLPLPYLFWDERLSTAAVTRAMIAADLSRQRRSETIDRAAAAYILQGALDAAGFAAGAGPGAGR